jgi:iron complex outermembrane receptor protein
LPHSHEPQFDGSIGHTTRECGSPQGEAGPSGARSLTLSCALGGLVNCLSISRFIVWQRCLGFLVLIVPFFFVICSQKALAQGSSSISNAVPQQTASTTRIAGEVVDSTESAIAGARITLRDVQGRLVRKGTTNVEGRFELSANFPGRYVLQVESKDFETISRDIVVSSFAPDIPLHITLGVASVQQTVSVNAAVGYSVPIADAGTKIDLPLMETPVAVQVIPAQVLADQQTVSLVNALTNVSGVAPTNDGYGTSDSFSIRGFDALTLLYQDGVKLDEYSTSGFPQDMANVDEVEVVKGPASVLYGQAEPGGLVNVVTKRPHENCFGSLGQQFGNHSFFRTTADLNQPLIRDKLLFRFILDRTDADSFREFIHTNELSLFPSATWRPNHFIDLTIQASFENGSSFLDNGIPFIAGVPDASGNAKAKPAPVPLSSNFIDPGLNKSPDTQYALKPTLTLHIAENWPLRILYKLEYHDNPTPIDDVYAGDANPSGNLGLLGFTTGYFHHRSSQVVTDMPGKFSLGPVKNTFLIGFDFYKDRGAYDYNFFLPSPINIFNPVYGQPPLAPVDPAQEGYNTLGFYEYGVYIQDVAELPGRFFILGGARLNWAEQFEDYAGSYVNKTDVHDHPTTPRAGLLWQANDHISLYSSYTTNYGASALGVVSPSHTFLPPQSADQVEFGAKSEWLDKRLTASTAVYRIIKHNVPAPDPVNPAVTIAIGTVRTQGVEADVAGQVSRDLRLIASYSNLQSLITRDTNSIAATGYPSEQGLSFGSIPHFTGSIWAAWEPHDGNLRGFKFGAGLQNRSGEQAYEAIFSSEGAATGWQLDGIPSNVITNLMAGYERPFRRVHIATQVNIENLFNEQYFSNVNYAQALPGAPFTILPALKISF